MRDAWKNDAREHYAREERIFLEQQLPPQTPEMFAEYREGASFHNPRPKPGEVNYEMRLMAYARAERFRGGW